MTNYYNILSIDNQLITIIEQYNDTQEYLLFIYYTCCMLGGFNSIDYLIHLIVYHLHQVIKIDLSLYFPYKVDIKEKMTNTIKYYNFYSKQQKKIITNFINNISKLNKITNDTHIYFPNKYKFYYENTTTLRGFNQYINFNKVYLGNFNEYKRIIDYFINDKDIMIMNKLIENNQNEDMIKIFKIYFQVPQLMHPNRHFWLNKESLFKSYNICVKNNNNNNCKPRTDNYNSNLITSLVTYGDCRDLALLLEFYLCYIEWNKYLNLLKNFEFKKIIKLIRNQYRIINVDVYMNGYYNKKLDMMQLINNNINNNTILYKNNKYIFYENHNFIINTKYHKKKLKFKSHDIMYNKYDLVLTENKNKKFYGEYIINNKKLTINDLFIDLKQNDYNENLNVICKIKEPFFINFRYENKLKNKFLYLSNNFTIPDNFYNINEFIITREKKYYELRKKYYNKNIKVYKYTKTSTYNSYFLLNDL